MEVKIILAIAFGFVLGVICISFLAKRLYNERKKDRRNFVQVETLENFDSFLKRKLQDEKIIQQNDEIIKRWRDTSPRPPMDYFAKKDDFNDKIKQMWKEIHPMYPNDYFDPFAKKPDFNAEINPKSDIADFIFALKFKAEMKELDLIKQAKMPNDFVNMTDLTITVKRPNYEPFPLDKNGNGGC